MQFTSFSSLLVAAVAALADVVVVPVAALAGVLTSFVHAAVLPAVLAMALSAIRDLLLVRPLRGARTDGHLPLLDVLERNLDIAAGSGFCRCRPA